MRALDVAAYLLDVSGPISGLRLHSLLYFSHLRYMRHYGPPPLPLQFEAWSHGPVVPELFARHRGYAKVTASVLHGGQATEHPEPLVRLAVADVLQAANALPDSTMRAWSREFAPWRQARTRAGTQGRNLRDSDPVHGDETGSPLIVPADYALVHDDVLLDLEREAYFGAAGDTRPPAS